MMSLTRWIRLVGKSALDAAGGTDRPGGARLGVESLGERLAPSASFWPGPDAPAGAFAFAPPPPGNFAFGPDGRGWHAQPPAESGEDAVATHFDIRAIESPYTSVPTRLAVTALNAANRPVGNYTGAVRLSSTDMMTKLPADYTFTADDRGLHLFEITPGATGTETITVTDTADAALTGSVTLSVTEAPVATHFAVRAIRQAGVGTEAEFVVVALDASNRRVRDYTGTVLFTSTDPDATLPADYTFTADDRGAHRHTAALTTAGSQTLTATDAANSSLTGSVAVNVGTNGGGHGPWFAFGRPGGHGGGR
jgi:hypothetical protein